MPDDGRTPYASASVARRLDDTAPRGERRPRTARRRRRRRRNRSSRPRRHVDPEGVSGRQGILPVDNGCRTSARVSHVCGPLSADRGTRAEEGGEDERGNAAHRISRDGDRRTIHLAARLTGGPSSMAAPAQRVSHFRRDPPRRRFARLCSACLRRRARRLHQSARPRCSRG